MKKQKGVTLLETILVLSLIAVIMVGGLSLYKNAAEQAKANSFIRDLQALVAQVKGINSDADAYTGTIFDSGIVPSSFTLDSGYLHHKDFSGTVGIDFYTPEGGCGQALFIYLYTSSSVSKEICMALGASDFGDLYFSDNCWGPGYYSFSSGSGSTSYSGKSVYPSVAEAAAACKGSGGFSWEIAVHR